MCPLKQEFQIIIQITTYFLIDFFENSTNQSILNFTTFINLFDAMVDDNVLKFAQKNIWVIVRK